jgi:hypothetical protein
MTGKRRSLESLSSSLRLGVFGAAAAGALVMAAAPAGAARPPGPEYSESTAGDLSNDGLAPTVIDFVLGNNFIEGWTGRDSSGAIDRDYFTFTLDPGQALEFIQVLTGTQSIGLSFIGVQEGNQVTVSPSGPDATGLLGWYHYTSADVGTDILDNIGVPAAGSTGFTPPLGPGTYSFWIQEASPGERVHYAFNFFVGEFSTAVPEPATWLTMLAGFGFAGMALRRSRRATPATA